MFRRFTTLEALIAIFVVLGVAFFIIGVAIRDIERHNTSVIAVGGDTEATNKYIVDEISNDKHAVIAWISSWKPNSVTLATGSGKYGTTLIIVGQKSN